MTGGPPTGGEDAIRAAVENAAVFGAEPPPPDEAGFSGESVEHDVARLEDCPIRPLGRYANVYHYLTAHGEVLSLPPAKHTAAELRGLFEGSTTWLYREFPRHNKDIVVGWNAGSLAAWLMRMCARRGFYDPAESIRGCGVWRDGKDGLVVHCGNEVWRKSGEIAGWGPAGLESDGYLYVAMPAREKPDFVRPANAREAEALAKFVAAKWVWRKPAHAKLFMGWVACAVIAGALSWRPHIHVAGHLGTGKTWLQDLAGGVIGSLVAGSEPTPAGIYHALGASNGAVMLDEVEQEADTDNWQRVLGLVRLGSSHNQPPILRGTSSAGRATGAAGQGVKYYIRAIFYLTGILFPEPKPQDRSRVTFVGLDSLPGEGDPAVVRREIQRFVAAAPRFRARMIGAWARYQANLVVLSSALANNGKTRRYADQVGSLLAGYETFVNDAVVEPAAADGLVMEISDAIGEEAEAEADWLQCLQLLSSARVDVWQGGDSTTVGALINEGIGELEGAYRAREALCKVGIKLLPEGPRAEWVVLGQSHQGLRRIFARSRWHDSAWRASLQTATEVARVGPQRSFKGHKSRTIEVALSCFLDVDPPPPKKDGDGEGAPAPPEKEEIPF